MPLIPAQNNLNGIAGWLILVAIGLAIGPVGLLLSIASSFFLALNSQGQSLLHARPGIAGVLILEATIDIVLFVAMLILNVLFYGKKKIFPMWAIAFLVASLLVEVAIHQMMLQYIPTYSSSGAFGSFIAALVWIPYFLLSQRVKQTFVN